MPFLPPAAAFAAALALIVVDVAAPPAESGPARYSREIQAKLAVSLRQVFATAEGFSYQWIANPDLGSILRAYTRSPELYDITSANTAFSRQLESQAASCPHIRDAVFFDTAENRRKPLTMKEDLPVAFLKELRVSAFAGEAALAGGKAVWSRSTLIQGGGRPVLLCARLIRGLTDGAELGLMVVFVDGPGLSGMLNGSSPEEDSPTPDIGKSDFTLLVSADADILISPDPSLCGRRLSDAFAGAGALEAALAAGSASGTESLSVNGVQRPAAFTRLEDEGLSILTVLPASGTARGNAPGIARRILLVLGALLFAAAVGMELRRRRRAGAGKAALAGLSPREREILERIASGKSNKQIAWELGIAEQTVKNYVYSLYDKLGIHDRVSAALLLNDGRG